MLLSVVVPVHRVQGYLRANLESVLGQGPGELELLVVDDGSRDGSAEIAAEFAARDPRVRVLTLPGHCGAGPARNAGVAEARGRYLLFLDGDDLLRPGALEAITGRLAASEPDVLLLGHDRIDWWGDVSAPASVTSAPEPVIPVPASVIPVPASVFPDPEPVFPAPDPAIPDTRSEVPAPAPEPSAPASALGLPVPASALGLPVPASALGLPVPASALGLPVPASALGLPVPASALGLPVPASAPSAPAPVPEPSAPASASGPWAPEPGLSAPEPRPLAPASGPPGPVPAASVADGFSTATPRLFRRAFWTAYGLHFTDGPYEDVLPVHRATLLATDAGTLDTLDRICVRRRIRRSGTFATTPGRHHFAILDAYERLLAETDNDPRIQAARTRHLRAVLADPGRTAPEDRAAFHRAAALPGSYAVHRAQEAARAGRTRTRAALRRRKKTLRARVMRAAYRTDLHRPLDPNLAVYGSYWNRGVACNPAAIHAKALELAPHIRGVWAVSSRHRDLMPPGIPYVIEGSRAYWRAMATATYLINNSSFPGGFTKRPGQRYLQTHHGTPLKTMGLDQRAYPALTNGISFEKIVAHADQWDFSLSANPHTTEIWDRVYPSGYEHLNLGYPRNDIFFTATPEQTAGIRQRLSLSPDRTVLLYAPTHRDYRKGFVPHLDLERLAHELGPDYVVLVRAHYFYGRSAQLDSAQVVDVTGYPSVEELCLVSDALITDYSSLMFDYACLDRPIISHAPDWAAYRASRGTYFDLLSGLPGDTPGAVATTEDELLELFRTGDWRSARTAELRTAFRERFCPYDDGHAAERVVRRLFLSDGE